MLLGGISEIGLVSSAAGVLLPQAGVERDVPQAAEMIETNITGHVSTLLAVGARMRAQGRGTIIVLSSVAAVRPRKANPVYGSAKAALDTFARVRRPAAWYRGPRGPGPARVRHLPDDRGHAARAAGHHPGGRRAGRSVGPAVARRSRRPVAARPATAVAPCIALSGRPPYPPGQHIDSSAVRVLVAADDEGLGQVLARGPSAVCSTLAGDGGAGRHRDEVAGPRGFEEG